MSGRSKERPELADAAIQLKATLSVLPCRGGEEFLRRLFEPLGYTVTAKKYPLDDKFAEWGDSQYFTVTLEGSLRLHQIVDASLCPDPGAGQRQALLGRRRRSGQVAPPR